jgi:NAD(P)-dependent dehydrogenase (short-subunit alcohol dehydrogenase family)
VIVSARNMKAVTKLCGNSGLIPLELDVMKEESITAAAAIIGKMTGRLDILINNAAGFYDQQGALLSTDLPFIQEAFNTNVLGALRMTKVFLPLLQKSGQPRIVNVSSSAGSYADPVFGLPRNSFHVPVYSLTKLALNGLTVKLARELKDTPLKVNAVCPGFVATYPGSEKWGARPVSEGAKGVVWAATLGPEGPSGGFYRDGQSIPW